jgi:hypothetical protein
MMLGGLIAALLVAAAAAAAAPTALAAPQPAWTVTAAPIPGHFSPGGEGRLLVKATNVGGGATLGESEIEATMPAGLTPTAGNVTGAGGSLDGVCVPAPPTITCEAPNPIAASQTIWAVIKVEADPVPPPRPPSTSRSAVEVPRKSGRTPP